MGQCHEPNREQTVRVADVVFDVRSGGSEAVYTYRAGHATRVGEIVLAPLSNRTLAGIAFRVYEASEAELGFSFDKLRVLEGSVEGSGLPPALVELVMFVASEFLAPLPAAAAPALPPGIGARIQTEWTLDHAKAEESIFDLTAAQDQVIELARKEGGRLFEAPGKPLAPALRKAVRLLESKGVLQRSTRLAARSPASREAALYRLTANEDAIEAFLREHAAKRPMQAMALLRLRGREHSLFSAADLQAIGSVSGAVVKAIAAEGLLEIVEPADRSKQTAPKPNAQQQRAIGAIVEAIKGKEGQGFLLHGVTGSGKTEVYLRAAAEALRSGRQVLYLVPEIALATQVIGHLRERFGNRVAVLHSELPPPDRLENWRRIAEGSAPLVLGARSALFAPLENIGLIVVDEEHEGAYKQESTPRYHARPLARFLSARHRCPYVLGSATPSVESFHAAQEGDLQRLELTDRANEAALPSVEIEDLGDGYRRGDPALLSQRLQELMVETMQKGEQTILFLNRRAYSPFLICRDCGHTFTCPRCAVSLTFSRSQMRLRCHHCGHQARPPDSCPNCQGRRLNPFGVGTEKVEEAVCTLLPEARVARLDRDVAQRKGALEATLAGFGAGDIDVLVGTQIVAKGLHFPNVSLVGVVAADVSLNIPDFRASERTFQLLSQVAGRAGRGDKRGRVVIQTFNPGHIAIQSARTHDDRGFLEATLAARQEARYPPFVRLVNVVFSGSSLADVLRTANQALSRLKSTLPEAELLGPVDCPIERVQNRWRKHILAKLPLDTDLHAVAMALKGLESKAVQVSADVDPQSLS